MPSFPSLLSLHDVACHRAGLRDLSFELAEREFLTLLGPGRGGKSAVLAILAGLMAADAGTIRLLGLSLAGVPTHRRGIGVVFSEDNLFGHLTVAENVALPLAVSDLGGRERRAKVARMLDLLRLRDATDQRPAMLAIADRQRAALARALVTEPPLLLLDDPLNGCDPQARKILLAELRSLQRSLGLGVIMATRIAADARALSDRIVVLLNGTLAQAGKPVELYERPVNAAVAACLGEVNRLPGVLRETDGDTAFVALDCAPLSEAPVVEATIADADIVGARCVVVVRPERVAVAATSARELGSGAVPAIVREVHDVGDHILLALDVGHARITVRRPAGALGGLVAGRAVAIAWQPHHAWVCRDAGMTIPD